MAFKKDGAAERGQSFLDQEAAQQATADDTREWPQLNSAALYGVAEEAVELATASSEADSAAVLFTFLASMAAVIGNGPRVMVGETAHVARINPLIVGASSRARKGTSARPVNTIRQAVEAILAEQRASRCIYRAGPLSSGEGLIYEVRDPVFDKEGEVTDKGIEDKRLLIVEGEFGASFRAMQREGNTLSTTLRVAWDAAMDHDILAPMTKNNRIQATNPHIVVIGHITGAELFTLLTSQDYHNGLANRLLWVCARRAKLLPIPPPIDQGALQALAQRIADNIGKAVEKGAIAFDAKAESLWCEIYDTLTVDRPGLWGAVTSRAEAQALRLALIYALLDGCRVIQAPHLEAALAAWHYCDHSARYLFGDAESDPNANKILQALQDGPKTQTELMAVFQRNITGEQLNKLLEHLQGAGRITSEKQKTGVKPKTVWTLNPNFSPPRDISE